MKNVLLSLALLAVLPLATAQTFPSPSPLTRTYQVVGLTNIEVEYSSPGTKGRQIFGDLVPYGQLWRTGANMATKISFSDKVSFGDKKVDAGEYALFTIPNESKITVMLNSNSNQGGTGSYDKSLDVATIEVPFIKTKKSVERLRFIIENSDNDGASLTFEWADRSFSVPIKVNTSEIASANFKEKMEELDSQFNLYNQAANYYFDSGDTKQALEMAQKSVSMTEKFWNLHTLAKIQAKNGDKAAAKKYAEKSMELASTAGNEDYVRLNKKLISEL